MKTDLDHLPPSKQRELARVVEIIHEEFADAMKLATSKKRKDGRILKIVLFGSYARGGWVDEPHTAKGYLSDYDLLIVVNQERLLDFSDYWYKAEDRLITEPAIKTPVNFIVHTLSEVNEKLQQGQYFFRDVVRDGIALYDLKGSKAFAQPQPLTAVEALETAKKYYDQWIPSAARRLEAFQFEMSKAAENENWHKDAAFTLHQAVERYYAGILLVLTNYSPSSHNVKFLRSLAEDLDARLIDVWPRETKHDRRCFELLKRAYVEARYSEHYKITEDELAWLGARAEALQGAVEEICAERLTALAEQI
ncbi:MAG: nucleotidyltransferase and HEPN domain-containing protein [Pseudomonadota bacterium]